MAVGGRRPPGGERPAAVDDAAAEAAKDATAAGGPPLEVHYCGGCNPTIDRVALAAEVAAEDGVGGTLYVSGCVRACASGSQLKIEEDAAVVVAGEHVDGRPTAAPHLAEKVKERLRESRKGTKG